MYIYDERGIQRDTDDLLLVERLEKLKASSTKPWDVIEELFKVFQKKQPKQWKSHLIEIDDIRETRKEKKFASSHDKAHDAYLRYTLDIPEFIMYGIRMLYTPDELVMDRKFYQEFAKRFPAYKVAEKL